MNSERWKRIEEIYYSVITSPAASRAVVLEELCLDDGDARQQVESLLLAREQAGNFLSGSDLQTQILELFDEPLLLASQTFSHYEIISAAGSGAMGEVYLARDTRLDRRVALKFLPSRFTQDNGRVARFQREAKAASALNHPNIITIYDIGEFDNTWFIAAEFIEGETLRNRLAAGALPLRETLGIAIQCAKALDAAHRAGIVHRDIKPENIMIRPDGLVKVVDFGLARVTKAKTEFAVDATQTGAVMGTPRYMSPEQARGESLDARTDVFSFGAVLYEMCTGRPAFPGATPAEVFAALLSATPRPPSEIVSGLPAGLVAIVSKALEKDLAARYQTLLECEADLEDLKQREESRSAPNSKKAAYSITGRFGLDWANRNLAIAAIALTVLLAVAVYKWSALFRGHSEGPPFSVVPLTSFAGFKDFASFSPDGTMVAFSWNGSTSGSGGSPIRSIYIKKIGSDDPSRLTFGREDERMPAWSPDGQSIAFCRALISEPRPTRYAIYTVPASGGEEHKVAEGELGVSWSPNGKSLAIAKPRSEFGGIVLLSLETGKRQQLTRSEPYIDSLPVFSPNGQWIAFTRESGFSAREIYIVPAAGGAAKRLTFDQVPTYGAAWTADSREIVFSSNRGRGGESLWRAAIKGGVPRPLSATLQGGFYPSVSRQGDRLVYTQSFQDTNIYSYSGSGFENRPGFTPARFGEPKPLILSSRRDDSPNISPDGTRIVFVSRRTGNEEIWASDRNGGHLLQLTSFRGPGTGTPRWSPDGKSIAFDSLAAGNSNIYIVSAAGGSPRRLTNGSSANFMPSWSADGNSIYFKSDRSGSDQIWKLAATGGTAVQLTHGEGCEAFASPDGKLLYFTKRAWGPIWTVPVDGGSEKPLAALAGVSGIFRSWGVINRGIYFISRQSIPHQTIRFYNFSTGRITALVTLNKEPIWDYPDVALSQDGRQLLVAALDQEVNDLMLIENFH